MPDVVVVPKNVKFLSKEPRPRPIDAGESVAQGDVVTLNTATRKHTKSISTDEDLSVADGIILTPASANGPCMLAPNGSEIDLGVDLGVGVSYYVSNTSGKIKPETELASGDYVTYLGTAAEARRLKLQINATRSQRP